MVETNALIAKFMVPDQIVNIRDHGRVVFIEPIEMQATWFLEELLYHKSWDWLMPVVFKIENLRLELPDYNVVEWFEVHRFSKTCLIKSGLRGTEEYMKSPYFYEQSNFGETEIEAVYKAVTKFIKWYNENVPKEK